MYTLFLASLIFTGDFLVGLINKEGLLTNPHVMGLYNCWWWQNQSVSGIEHHGQLDKFNLVEERIFMRN